MLSEIEWDFWDCEGPGDGLDDPCGSLPTEDIPWNQISPLGLSPPAGTLSQGMAVPVCHPPVPMSHSSVPKSELQTAGTE